VTPASPTPDAPDTRSAVEALILEGRSMLADHDDDLTGWARQAIAALAAESERADRAEAERDRALSFALTQLARRTEELAAHATRADAKLASLENRSGLLHVIEATA